MSTVPPQKAVWWFKKAPGRVSHIQLSAHSLPHHILKPLDLKLSSNLHPQWQCVEKTNNLLRGRIIKQRALFLFWYVWSYFPPFRSHLLGNEVEELCVALTLGENGQVMGREEVTFLRSLCSKGSPSEHSHPTFYYNLVDPECSCWEHFLWIVIPLRRVKRRSIQPLFIRIHWSRSWSPR